MRRSPGAAPVGASDRKVSLPIGRCDGGARGTRGRASYVASSTRTRSLRGLDAVSVAPRHRFARADAAFLLRRSPAAPLDGSLFRRWSSLSLRPAALAVLFSPSSLSLSLSLCRTHAPLSPWLPRVSRLSSIVSRPSSLESALAPLQTHGIGARPPHGPLYCRSNEPSPPRVSQLRRARHGVQIVGASSCRSIGPRNARGHALSRVHVFPSPFQQRERERVIVIELEAAECFFVDCFQCFLVCTR